MKAKVILLGILSLLVLGLVLGFGIFLTINGTGSVIDLAQLKPVPGKPLAWGLVRMLLGIFTIGASFIGFYFSILIYLFDNDDEF